jgi:hypothetical protein
MQDCNPDDVESLAKDREARRKYKLLKVGGCPCKLNLRVESVYAALF